MVQQEDKGRKNRKVSIAILSPICHSGRICQWFIACIVICNDQFITNIIQQTMRFLSWLLSVAVLRLASSQSVAGSLTISLSNPVVQAQSDYTFNLIFVYNDPFVVGTYFEITFPAEYVSSATATYSCELTTWPFPVSVAPVCQITNRVLTLNGAFPQQYSITQDTVFEFVVHGVGNPQFAGQTSAFVGRAARPDLSTITAINNQMVIILTGSLAVQLASSPAVVSTAADLEVLVTTSHPLPANAILRIYTSTNVWDRASTIYPETIFRSSPSCNYLNNTPSNLYCTTAILISQRILTVYNINPLNSASAGPATFSFKISTIQTPPSTEPQGAFSLVVMDSSSRPIDSSQNNKMGGLSPKQIVSQGVLLDNYVAGELSNLSITVSISSIIETSDTLSIQVPNCISLSSLSFVRVGSTQIPTFAINSNIISFVGLQVVIPIPITIWLSQVRNPEFVADVSSLGSVFSIWTSRNGYKIDSVSNAFTYVTSPGWISCTSLTAVSSQAGVLTSYTFALQFQHNISKDSQLQIAFTPTHFGITSNDSLTCSTSLSTGCSLVVLSANLIKLSNLISTSNANRYGSISVIVTGVRNPTSAGQFSGLQASTYTQNGYLVDRTDNMTGFSVTSRQLESSRVLIASTSPVVYALTDVTLTISTNNPLSPSSRVNLLVPDSFDTASLLCTPYCSVAAPYNGYYSYSIDVSSFYNSSSPATIVVLLSSLRNPKSTRPTASFQVRILDDNGQQLEYVTSGLEYRLCTVAAALSVSLSRNSSINSDQYVGYSFRIGLSFSIPNAVAVRLEIPSSVACTSCISSTSTSTAYSTYLTVTASSTPIVLTAFVQSIVGISLTNHFSFEPITIIVSVVTSDLAHSIGMGAVTATNTMPNTLSLTYSFGPVGQQMLTSTTTLSLSSIAVTYGGFAYIDILLGSEFDANWAYLSSGTNYYNLTAISSTLLRITKTTVTSALLAEGVAIANISTPAFTPSTGIVVETFTNSNYRADRSVATMVWQTSCNLPCRSCLGSPDNCQSCYSDPVLAQSRILLFANGSSTTCLAQCPDAFYLQSSSSSCQPCSSSCATCATQSQLCTTCPALLPYLLALSSNGTLSSSVCYRTCPAGYYASNETSPSRCLACSSDRHCATCDNYLSCNSCQPTYFLFLQQCLPSCPNLTTVANEYAWSCDGCPNNCSTCATDTASNSTLVIKCLACSSGYLLDRDRCYSGCVSYGLVPDLVTGQCTGCHASCLTCAQSASNCLSCNTSSQYAYFLLNKCLVSCPNGYYASASLWLCLPCTSPCEYCNTSSVSSCLSCVAGFSLFGSVCQGFCPPGYYQNASNCLGCPSQCLSCTSPTLCGACAANYSLFAGECLPQCPNGYAQISRVCIQCSTNCRTCSLVNYCLTCMGSLYLYQGQCVSPCPPKFYPLLSSSQTVCTGCPFECSECSSPSVCLSCISGYQLVTANSTYASCNSLCSTGFVPISGVCQPCLTGCLGCTYTQSNCSACAPNYYLYRSVSTSTCYAVCPVSLFAHAPSLSCMDACSTSMFANITYSASNSSIIVKKECVDCPALCLSCSASACLSCRSGSAMLEGACYSTCPARAPYASSQRCVTCNIDQCFECSDGVCVQCNSNYLLILTARSNLCISGCSANMIYNVSERDCIYISNGTDGNGTTANATTTTSSSSINFIPLPYAMVGVVAVAVVLVLKVSLHVQVYSNLFAIFSVLLQMAIATTFAALLAQFVAAYNSASASASARLLAQSQPISIQDMLNSSASYKIMMVMAFMLVMLLLLNIVVFILYCCIVRTPAYRYRVVSLLSVVLGCKLIGGLLTAGYYGINMKTLTNNSNNNSNNKPQQQPGHIQQSGIREEHEDEHINNTGMENSRGRSKYARTATRKLSQQADTAFLQQLIQKKQNAQAANKHNSNNNNNRNNNNNEVPSKISKVSAQSQSKSKSKKRSSQVDDNGSQARQQSIHIMIDDEQVQSEADVSQHSDKRFIDGPRSQAKQKQSLNMNMNMVDMDGQPQQQQRVIGRKRTNRSGHKGPSVSQSINSSFYKPSQPHSLPNPKPSRQSIISAPHDDNSITGFRVATAEQRSSQQQDDRPANGLQMAELQQAINQYDRFWFVYDRAIMFHYVIDPGLVSCGIMLCFKSTYAQYQFYGGIEIAMLAILDFVCTCLWNHWNHTKPNPKSNLRPEQQDITSKYTTNKFMDSEFSNEKLFRPQDHDEPVLTDSHSNKEKQDWQKQIASEQQYTQLGQKETKTEANNAELVKPAQRIGRQEGNLGNDLSRVYQSEYARPIDVVKLKNEQIEQALERGVYRQDKKALAQEQQREDEQSKLDNAEKFNRASKQSITHSAEPSSNKNKSADTSKTKQKDNSSKKIVNGVEVQKDIDEIIFENNDEESLDTKGDEEAEENNIVQNQARRRKGSLGSEKQKNESKLIDPIPTVYEKVVNLDKQPRQSPQKKATISIEDLQRIDLKRQQNEDKLAQLGQQQSREYTNIFEGELEEDGISQQQQLVAHKSNSRKQEQQLDIKNVYRNRKQAKTAMNAYEVQQDMLKVVPSKRPVHEVIYADLDSVGTMSEFDAIDQQTSELNDDNLRQGNATQNNQFKSLQYGNDPAVHDELVRPSDFIKINFRYHNRNSGNEDALPRALIISRPKKSSKKSAVSKVIN